MEALWPLWAIAAVLVIACRHETIIILSGLPWWHRVLGVVAAGAFYGAHLIGR
jgi:hypothetical protein